jgi:hypothetical protein
VPDAERHLLVPGVGRYLEGFRARGMGKDELLRAERASLRVFVSELTGYLPTHRATAGIGWRSRSITACRHACLIGRSIH